MVNESLMVYLYPNSFGPNSLMCGQSCFVGHMMG